MGVYSVTRNDQSVGTVTVTARGLYYEIYGVCRLPDRPHRLQAVWQDRVMDLGILVPSGRDYILRKSIAAKQMKTGAVTFIATEPSGNNTFIPVEPGVPFLYLTKLEQMRLVTVDGRKMLQLDG